MKTALTFIESVSAIKDSELLAGEVYCFTAPEQSLLEPIIGIFDSATDDGRVILEVAQTEDGNGIEFNLTLPMEYCFVRSAASFEIRDFAFDYGYHCAKFGSSRRVSHVQ